MAKGKLRQKLEKFVPMSQHGSDDTMIDRYITDHQHKDPRPGIRYVGIEVECFSKMSKRSLQKLFFLNDLEEFVMIGSDGSIRPPDYNMGATSYNRFELRLLIPEKSLTKVLKKFGLVFRTARLGVNSSCGLHVHLDMRQRDKESCYKKLLKFQDALFALVNEDRWGNTYCQFVGEYGDEDDHHNAINQSTEYETIEVRMHHGCVDTNKIEKWVRLLINVVDAKSVPKIKSKSEVLRWKGLHKRIRGYVARNFKADWFHSGKYIEPEEDNW